MATSKKILEQAIALSPIERAKLIDQLMFSLDKPDQELDKQWAEEAESRLEAYKKGEMQSLSVEEVLAKYK